MNLAPNRSTVIGRMGHRAYILRAISVALERVRGPGALEPGNPARKWWGDVSLIGSPHVVGDILHPYDIWCAGPVRWYRELGPGPSVSGT